MKKILLVENDPNFGKVLKHQLSQMGLEVDDVSGGEVAVERCKEESTYQLVVADVNVPAVNTLSYLQLIKLKKPHLPVLVLSAFSAMENVAAAFRYGADDLLEKPYDLSVLQAKIRL